MSILDPKPLTIAAAATTYGKKSDQSRSLADYGVLPGNTAAQNRQGFLDAQNSGYVDFTLPPGTYQWAAAGNGQWMMTFTGKKRIRIRGIDAVINDTTAYSNNGPIEGVFLFDNCKDVEVSGIEYVGQALASPGTLHGYQGATLVRAINGTDGVKVDMRASHCRYGVQTGDYSNAATGGCKNFDVKLRGTMIGYGIAAYRADGIRHDLDVDGVHRAAYIAGCNDVTGVARWRDQYIAPTAYVLTDCLTSGTDAAAQADPVGAATTSRGCTNIDVTVIDKGSTVFQTQSMCAGITLSRVDPCRYENIRVKVYVVGTDTVSTRVGGFTLASSGVPGIWSRYTYNWEPTIVLDNIAISGIVDHSAQTLASNATGELYIYTKDDAGEASGKYATVRGLTVDGLTILKSSAASPRPVVIVAREPAVPILLRNLNAPGLTLSLHTSNTVTTKLEGVTAASIDHSSLAGGSLVSMGAGCNIASRSGSMPVRTGGNAGIGGAGGIITQKETTLTLSGASTTWTAAIPGGSMLLGVQGRVQTAITGASGIQVGVTGDATRFRNGDGTAVGTTFGPNGQAVATNPLWYLANTDIIITARTANFTGGTLRVVLTYISFNAPTA